MVDIEALSRALPVCQLEPQTVASLGGWIDLPESQQWRERIDFLEPPAGQDDPYVSPADALEKMFRHRGMALEEAKALARDTLTAMLEQLPKSQWAYFFDYSHPDPPPCLPIARFVAWIREESGLLHSGALTAHMLDFLESAAAVAANVLSFQRMGNIEERRSLRQLPAQTPPEEMVEFVPGLPWGDHGVEPSDDATPENNEYLRWRESIRPVAMALEQALGKSVFYFSDWSDEFDDDAIHRFLVLHWCCSHRPESSFVRYLVRSSGARDVEDLKAALVDPLSYVQPFQMNSGMHALEASGVYMDYLPPNQRRTACVVFLTARARDVAFDWLQCKIGFDLVIAGPKELVSEDWLLQATRYAAGWEARYLQPDFGQLLDLLAIADDLCVVMDERPNRHGFDDFRLPHPIEDMLWKAREEGMAPRCLLADRGRFDLEALLPRSDAASRSIARDAIRKAHTAALSLVRVNADFSGSGLWDSEGRSLNYEGLDIPFALVRRIARWQRDFDELAVPSAKATGSWWARHRVEEKAIALDLKAALPNSTSVEIIIDGEWVAV